MARAGWERGEISACHELYQPSLCLHPPQGKPWQRNTHTPRNTTMRKALSENPFQQASRQACSRSASVALQRENSKRPTRPRQWPRPPSPSMQASEPPHSIHSIPFLPPRVKHTQLLLNSSVLFCSVLNEDIFISCVAPYGDVRLRICTSS